MILSATDGDLSTTGGELSASAGDLFTTGGELSATGGDLSTTGEVIFRTWKVPHLTMWKYTSHSDRPFIFSLLLVF